MNNKNKVFVLFLCFVLFLTACAQTEKSTAKPVQKTETAPQYSGETEAKKTTEPLKPFVPVKTKDMYLFDPAEEVSVDFESRLSCSKMKLLMMQEYPFGRAFFKTKNEFDSFAEEVKTRAFFSTDDASLGTLSFEEAIKKYDSNFFQTKSLLVVRYTKLAAELPEVCRIIRKPVIIDGVEKNNWYVVYDTLSCKGEELGAEYIAFAFLEVSAKDAATAESIQVIHRLRYEKWMTEGDGLLSSELTPVLQDEELLPFESRIFETGATYSAPGFPAINLIRNQEELRWRIAGEAEFAEQAICGGEPLSEALAQYDEEFFAWKSLIVARIRGWKTAPPVVQSLVHIKNAQNRTWDSELNTEKIQWQNELFAIVDQVPLTFLELAQTQEENDAQIAAYQNERSKEQEYFILIEVDRERIQDCLPWSCFLVPATGCDCRAV